MLPRIFAAMTTIAALWLTSTAAAQDKKDMSEQAKVVAEKFVKALLVDLKADDAMEFVAVPYFHMGRLKGQNGKPMVLKKLDAVKQEITVFVKNRNGEKLTGKLSSRENTYDLFPRSDSKQERKALDEVMKKTDRVVTVRLATDSEKSVGGSAELTVLVSWRNGQPKVAGYVGDVNQSIARARLILDVAKVEGKIPDKGKKLELQVKVKNGAAVVVNAGAKAPKGCEFVISRNLDGILVVVSDAAEAGSWDIWVADSRDDDLNKAKFKLVLK